MPRSACPAVVEGHLITSVQSVTSVSVEPAGRDGTEADDEPKKGRLEKPLPAEKCR